MDGGSGSCGTGANILHGTVFTTRDWISVVRWGASSVGRIFVFFVGTTTASGKECEANIFFKLKTYQDQDILEAFWHYLPIHGCRVAFALPFGDLILHFLQQ